MNRSAARAMFLPLVVPLVIAFLLGWFIGSLVRGDALPNGHILTAAATLSAAWWVQRALRRQAELDRIPIESASKSGDRIGELTNKCLDLAGAATPTDPILVHTLRLISNEVTWLRTLVTAVGGASLEYEGLQRHYLAFKDSLTGGPTIASGQAAKHAMIMRTRCIQIRLRLAKDILNRDPDFDSVAGTNGDA